MALNQLGLGLNFVATDFASPVIRRLMGNLTALDVTLAKTTRSLNAGAVAQHRYARLTGGAATAIRGQNAAIRTSAAATPKAAAATKQAATANTALATSAGSAAARFGLLAGAAVGVYGAFKAADAASNFNQQLVATQKIMGATTAELDAMENKILEVGLSTKFSPDQIVEGMKGLGAAGQSASQAMNTIKPAALLATAGQIELDRASMAIVGTLNAFQMEADEAALVADKLTKATQLSNLQANDFEAGLSKASAGMATFGQSFDDTLVGLGALRNANIDASSSSTALRESARRVFSDPAARSRLKKLGIDTDALSESQHGLIESIFAVDAATKDMTKAQRDENVAKIFGARGLLAFNAITKTTFKTMRDGREVTLRGQEAFEAMRESIQGAAGTAEDFNDALLDTFEGQKQILGGAVDTLKVVFGQGFAQVLKPVVRFVAESVSQIAKFFKELEPQTKEAIAKFVTIGAAVAGVAGAIVMLGGPVSAVIAVVVGAVIGLKRIIDTNVGGIKDTLQETFGRVVLFFKGFAQLITDGFLSGDTLASLMKEENKNVLTTLQVLVQVGYRIKRFFGGLMEGFQEGMAAAAPTFKALKEAFFELGKALGITGREFSKVTTPSERFAEIGKRVGGFLARVVEIGAQFLTFLVRFRAGVIKGFKAVMTYAQPVFEFLGESFRQFGEAIWGVLEQLGLVQGGFGSTGDFADRMGQAMGMVMTGVIVPLSAALGAMVRITSWVIKAIHGLIWVFQNIWAFGQAVVKLFGTDIPNAFKAFEMRIREIFKPVTDLIDKTIGRLEGGIDTARKFAAQFGLSTPETGSTVALAAQAANAAASPPGAGAAARAQGTNAARQAEEQAETQNRGLAKALGQFLGGTGATTGPAAPFVAQVFLNDEQIATAVANGREAASAAEFGG